MTTQGLTAKQVKLLKALLVEPTIEKACERAGVSRMSAYVWLKDDKFSVALENARTEAIGGALRYMQSSYTECVEALMEIVRDKSVNPQIRISAINSVFNNSRIVSDHYEVAGMIAHIEELLDESTVYKGTA